MEINGFSAVVTGGASGLGEATSQLLADKGMKVVVMDLDRQQDKGDALAKEIGGIFAPADVTDGDQVKAGIDAAVEMAPLRVLVNCAGIGWPGRTIDKNGNPHDLDVFRKVIDINLVGTFNCIRLAASAMNSNTPDDDGQRGAIVNTASVAAYDGQIGQAAYSASKGGVVGMTLTVARDLAAAGIRVNTIAPGLIDTPIYGEGDASEAFKAALGKDVLFPRRLGVASEFASLALELITNNYMNAQDIRVDGGIRMPPKS
jgi:NAD(P)-dependent dehydrogenase (short-subunit alcohol dehydrogenase family)